MRTAGGCNEGLIYGLGQGLAGARQARCGKAGRGVVWLAKAGGIECDIQPMMKSCARCAAAQNAP